MHPIFDHPALDVNKILEKCCFAFRFPLGTRQNVDRWDNDNNNSNNIKTCIL